MLKNRKEPKNKENQKKHDFICIINDKARAEKFKKIMGTNEIPILSPIPFWSKTPVGKMRFFKMDISILTNKQKKKFIKILAKKFSLPRMQVDRDFEKFGIPILDDNVTIIINNPGILL